MSDTLFLKLASIFIGIIFTGCVGLSEKEEATSAATQVDIAIPTSLPVKSFSSGFPQIKNYCNSTIKCPSVAAAWQESMINNYVISRLIMTQPIQKVCGLFSYGGWGNAGQFLFVEQSVASNTDAVAEATTQVYFLPPGGNSMPLPQNYKKVVQQTVSGSLCTDIVRAHLDTDQFKAALQNNKNVKQFDGTRYEFFHFTYDAEHKLLMEKHRGVINLIVDSKSILGQFVKQFTKFEDDRRRKLQP